MLSSWQNYCAYANVLPICYSPIVILHSNSTQFGRHVEFVTKLLCLCECVAYMLQVNDTCIYVWDVHSSWQDYCAYVNVLPISKWYMYVYTYICIYVWDVHTSVHIYIHASFLCTHPAGLPGVALGCVHIYMYVQIYLWSYIIYVHMQQGC